MLAHAADGRLFGRQLPFPIENPVTVVAGEQLVRPLHLGDQLRGKLEATSLTDPVAQSRQGLVFPLKLESRVTVEQAPRHIGGGRLMTRLERVQLRNQSGLQLLKALLFCCECPFGLSRCRLRPFDLALKRLALLHQPQDAVLDFALLLAGKLDLEEMGLILLIGLDVAGAALHLLDLGLLSFQFALGGSAIPAERFDGGERRFVSLRGGAQGLLCGVKLLGNALPLDFDLGDPKIQCLKFDQTREMEIQQTPSSAMPTPPVHCTRFSAIMLVVGPLGLEPRTS